MALIKSLRGATPTIGPDVFLAETATIIGQVRIGARCSIWYGVVLRGDVHWIEIGEETNVQDGAIVHCTYQRSPTKIGAQVTIGHGAIVHGCTVQDKALIGMGAVVLDDAVVETGAIVAAGAVVTSRTVVESGSIYAGAPARKVKSLGPEGLAGIEEYARQYLMYRDWYLQAPTALQQATGRG